MDNGAPLRADRILRWIHLYTGLFLLPWMLVYGASAFCLNHNQWLIEKLNVTPPHWETLRRVCSWECCRLWALRFSFAGEAEVASACNTLSGVTRGYL